MKGIEKGRAKGKGQRQVTIIGSKPFDQSD